MNYLIALAAGALLPLSLAPHGIWPLGLLSVGAWFWALRGGGGRDWLLGWWFGVGKYAVGASWVYVSIHTYGAAPVPLAAALVALFVAGVAWFAVLNAVLFARLRTGDPIVDALSFAVVFVISEWVLTWLLTGFPWLFVGHAHLDTALRGLVPVGGVLLASLGAALTATLLVAAARLWWQRRASSALPSPYDLSPRRAGIRLRLAFTLTLACVPWVAGALLAPIDWVRPGDTRSVALVQGNVDQAIKWEADASARVIRTHVDLTEPHWDAGLIIWPEAALVRFEHEVPDLLQQLDARARAGGSALVLGIPYAERVAADQVAYYNAVRVLGTGSGRYLKQRLVPFGEYVPLEGVLRGLIAFFDLPMSGFSRGPEAQPLLDIGGLRAAMAICYEVVYPELVRQSAAGADVLLTVSNDTWFGASAGPLQHLEMARMRALEHGRWLLRATNNGVTAVVDARGRVRARLPQFQAGVLQADWMVMHGVTPYTRYGYLPVVSAALVLAGLAFWIRRRGLR